MCPSSIRLADKSGTKRSGQMPDDERAIRELIQSWLTASQKGDLQTALSLMMDAVVFEDLRFAYGERSFKAFAPLNGRLYAMCFTVRRDMIRVIGLRKANQREREKYESP